MIVVGKKVILRAIEFEDLELLRHLKNDPWIESMVVGWSFPISKAQQQNWYNNLHEEKNAIRFIIETKTDGAIGYTTLTNIDWKNRCATGATMLAKEYTSKGIAIDAVLTRYRYAFDELQLNRVEGSILVYNHASRRLYEKLGCKVEGVKRKAIYKNGDYHDLLMVAILREEYQAMVKENNYWDTKECE